MHRARRGDERAQPAIHPPFCPELARAVRLQGAACGDAGRELAQRRFRGELAAAHREPHSVAGHRVDESRGIAGQQQTRIANRLAVHRERTERRDFGDLPRAHEAGGQQRIAAHRQMNNRVGVHALRAEYVLQLAHDADVHDVAGKRRDADVAVGADVHLPVRRDAFDIGEIGAECPAFRRGGVAGEPHAEGQLRMTAVGGDDDARVEVVVVAAGGDANADDTRGVRGDERRADDDAAFKRRPRGDRRIDQQLVQHATRQRSSAYAGRVIGGHQCAAGAADRHAADRQRALTNRRGDAEAVEDRQRSRIQRVATELVARKARAIRDAHADAGAGEDERGNAARRASADDEYVGRHFPTRPTRLVTLPAPVPTRCSSIQSQGNYRAPRRSPRGEARSE